MNSFCCYEEDDHSDCMYPPPPPIHLLSQWSSPQERQHLDSSPLSPFSPHSSPPPPPPQIAYYDDEEIDQGMIDRQILIANRFHHYVTLVKCLCSWNTYIKERENEIKPTKKILRRILLKWSAYVEEATAKSYSSKVIFQCFSEFSQRKMQLGLRAIYEHSLNSTLLEKAFSHWVEVIRALSKLREEKRLSFQAAFKLNMTRACFYGWMIQSKLRVKIDARAHSILLKIMNHWKSEATFSSCNHNVQLKRAMAQRSEQQFRLMKKLFSNLKYYSSRKRQRESMLTICAQQRETWIMFVAFKSWSASLLLTKKRIYSITTIMKKRAMSRWRCFIESNRYHEHILVQIIFNRWRYYTEEKIFRREKQLIALNHRVTCLCRMVLLAWMKAKVEHQNRFRLPNSSKYFPSTSTCFGKERHLYPYTKMRCTLQSLHNHSSKYSHFSERASPSVSSFINSNPNIFVQKNLYKSNVSMQRNSFVPSCPSKHQRFSISKFNPIIRKSPRLDLSRSSSCPRPILESTNRVGSKRSPSIPPRIIDDLSITKDFAHCMSPVMETFTASLMKSKPNYDRAEPKVRFDVSQHSTTKSFPCKSVGPKLFRSDAYDRKDDSRHIYNNPNTLQKRRRESKLVVKDKNYKYY